MQTGTRYELTPDESTTSIDAVDGLRNFVRLRTFPNIPQSVGNHHQPYIKTITKLLDMRRRYSDTIEGNCCYV